RSLTFDRRTVKTLLDEARIGFAGLSTAMGDAIAIAIKRLEGRPATSKVLILLSDGADTASEVPPLKAAELAARHGVRIHTIGVGSGELTARGLFGERRFNPSADLDEDTLTAIAEATGGRYFRARDPAELAEVYAALDALEPVVQEGETLRPTRALFHWPLAVALLGWALLLATAQRRGDHGGVARSPCGFPLPKAPVAAGLGAPHGAALAGPSPPGAGRPLAPGDRPGAAAPPGGGRRWAFVARPPPRRRHGGGKPAGLRRPRRPHLGAHPPARQQAEQRPGDPLRPVPLDAGGGPEAQPPHPRPPEDHRP